MSTVRFIHEPRICQFGAPIADAYLIGPGAAFPNASADLELEVLGEFLLIMIQVGICTKSRKLVAVYNNIDITSSVVEAARRAFPCHKPNGLESAPITELPDVTSVTAAVCASDQSTNKIGCMARIFWQMHEQVADWIAVEIGCLDVNNADSQGLALPVRSDRNCENKIIFASNCGVDA